MSALDARNRETLDYYTMWVHQIKTPIAAMGLILQDDETERGLALRPELFRVERYVELVLSYLRMGGGASDYVIRQVNVDGVLRQAVRKYAPLFIRGKVALDLEETGLKALSDDRAACPAMPSRSSVRLRHWIKSTVPQISSRIRHSRSCFGWSVMWSWFSVTCGWAAERRITLSGR